jgi:hypothetical protein
MTFVGLPRLQMIARGEQMKSAVYRLITKIHQLSHRKLFVREHVANEPFADAIIGLAQLVGLRTCWRGGGGRLCRGNTKRRRTCQHSGEFE